MMDLVFNIRHNVHKKLSVKFISCIFAYLSAFTIKAGGVVFFLTTCKDLNNLIVIHFKEKNKIKNQKCTQCCSFLKIMSLE